MTRNLVLVAVAGLVLAGCTAADASTSTVDPAPEQAPVESAMAKWEALPEFQQAGMCRLLLTDGEAYRANASSAEGYAMFDVMDEVCPTLTVSDVAESISPEVHWNLVAMGVSSVGPDGSPATTYELAGALAQAFYRSGPPSLDDLNVSFRAPAGHIYQSLVTQGGMDFATYDRIFIAMRDLVRSGGSRLDGSDVSEDVGTTDFPEGSTMAELAAAGEITIGTKFDQPGFGLLNPATNEPEGFEVELAKIIASELGIGADGITWVETVSANREPFIQEGRVDYVVATYTINDDRKEVVDFAGPYYQAGQDIMVASGNPLGIEGPDDLAGTTTCSVEGSTPAENIRTNYPDAEITLFDVYSKCSEALKNGQVDSVTTDNVILLGIIAQDPESFELVDNPFTEEPYGIGLELGNEEFRSFINDVLEASFEDGRWAAAWESTAGRFAETPEPPAVDPYAGRSPKVDEMTPVQSLVETLARNTPNEELRVICDSWRPAFLDGAPFDDVLYGVLADHPGTTESELLDSLDGICYS